MKRLNNILGGINWLLVMAVISNYIFLLIMKDFLPEVQPPDWMARLVAITILVMGLINLINLFGITKQFQYFKQANFLSSGSFVLGFFSLFMLVVSVVMLQDIGQEAKVGFESTGEWNMVFFGQSLQHPSRVVLQRHARHGRDSGLHSHPRHRGAGGGAAPGGRGHLVGLVPVHKVGGPGTLRGRRQGPGGGIAGRRFQSTGRKTGH